MNELYISEYFCDESGMQVLRVRMCCNNIIMLNKLWAVLSWYCVQNTASSIIIYLPLYPFPSTSTWLAKEYPNDLRLLKPTALRFLPTISYHKKSYKTRGKGVVMANRYTWYILLLQIYAYLCWCTLDPLIGTCTNVNIDCTRPFTKWCTNRYVCTLWEKC